MGSELGCHRPPRRPEGLRLPRRTSHRRTCTFAPSHCRTLIIELDSKRLDGNIPLADLIGIHLVRIVMGS